MPTSIPYNVGDPEELGVVKAFHGLSEIRVLVRSNQIWLAVKGADWQELTEASAAGLSALLQAAIEVSKSRRRS